MSAPTADPAVGVASPTKQSPLSSSSDDTNNAAAATSSISSNTAAASVSPASPPLPQIDMRLQHTTLLNTPAPFLKFGRSGKPHSTLIHTSPDFQRIYWGKKHVSVSELVQVLDGRQSAVFKKFDSTDAHMSALSSGELDILTKLSFSLMFQTRSLDLQVEYHPPASAHHSHSTKKKEQHNHPPQPAPILTQQEQEKLEKDVEKRNAWIAAFRWLLAQQQQLQQSGPPSARRVSDVGGGLISPRTSLTPGGQQTPDPTTRHHAFSVGSTPSTPLQQHQLTDGTVGSPLVFTTSPLSPGFHTGDRRLSSPAAPADNGISRPTGVVRTTHVNSNFQWERERLDEDFKLVKKLGEGAFAEVWLARHNLLGFEVAVKCVLLSNDTKVAAKERESIKDEIAILRLCRNKYISGYLGACPTPDALNRMWLLMDYYSIGSILNLIDRTQVRLQENEIAFIIHSVLMGLIYLNSRNICHRDIKARNILINEKGDVALADFGVSKILHASAQTNDQDGSSGGGTGSTPQPAVLPQQTPTNIAGSPSFMAPEVIAGKVPDFKSDIWSIGVTCLELANNGRVPHDELGSPFRVMKAIRSSAPPTLHWQPIGELPGVKPAQQSTPRWSSSFHDFVSKCLEPDPAFRADAVSLLSHPFVSNASSPQIMSHQLKLYEEQEKKRMKKQMKQEKKQLLAQQQQQQQQQQAMRASPANVGAGVGFNNANANPNGNGKQASILDSLFKFLGRKGPTNSAVKSQVDLLRQKGRLDEMGEDEETGSGGKDHPAGSGPGGSGAASSSADGLDGLASDTRVLTGSDTCVLDVDALGAESGVDSEDVEDLMIGDSAAGSKRHSPVQNATAISAVEVSAPTSPQPAVDGKPVKSPIASSAAPESPLPSTPGTAAQHVAPPSLTSAPPTHQRRPSHNDALIRCTAGQLHTLGVETGIEGQKLNMLIAKVVAKYSIASSNAAAGVTPSQPQPVRRKNSLTSLPPAVPVSSPGVGVSGHVKRRSGSGSFTMPPGVNGGINNNGIGGTRTGTTPGASPVARPSPSTAGYDLDDDELSLHAHSTTPAPTTPAFASLFPGCTPSSDSEEYISALEYATVQVCGLSRNDLTALKRMANAPPPVRMAIESVGLILGVKPYLVTGRESKRMAGGRVKPSYDYWSPAQAILVRPNFLTLLKGYDFTKSLSPDIIDLLHEFASDRPATYTPEVVSSSSNTAGILWNWTRSIYNYATHVIGYKPSGWNENSEANALTVSSSSSNSVFTVEHGDAGRTMTSSPAIHPTVSKPLVRRPSRETRDTVEHHDDAATSSSSSSTQAKSPRRSGANAQQRKEMMSPTTLSVPGSNLTSPVAASSSSTTSAAATNLPPRVSSTTTTAASSGASTPQPPTSERESPAPVAQPQQPTALQAPPPRATPSPVPGGLVASMLAKEVKPAATTTISTTPAKTNGTHSSASASAPIPVVPTSAANVLISPVQMTRNVQQMTSTTSTTPAPSKPSEAAKPTATASSAASSSSSVATPVAAAAAPLATPTKPVTTVADVKSTPPTLAPASVSNTKPATPAVSVSSPPPAAVKEATVAASASVSSPAPPSAASPPPTSATPAAAVSPVASSPPSTPIPSSSVASSKSATPTVSRRGSTTITTPVKVKSGTAAGAGSNSNTPLKNSSASKHTKSTPSISGAATHRPTSSIVVTASHRVTPSVSRAPSVASTAGGAAGAAHHRSGAATHRVSPSVAIAAVAASAAASSTTPLKHRKTATMAMGTSASVGTLPTADASTTNGDAASTATKKSTPSKPPSSASAASTDGASTARGKTATPVKAAKPARPMTATSTGYASSSSSATSPTAASSSATSSDSAASSSSVAPKSTPNTARKSAPSTASSGGGGGFGGTSSRGLDATKPSRASLPTHKSTPSNGAALKPTATNNAQTKEKK